MVLPLSVLVPITLVGLIFLYLLWTYSYWYRNGVLQENPLKLFKDNDFTLTWDNKTSLYIKTYKKYKEGPFIGIYQLFKPAIFLRDPNLIKDVMSNTSKAFPDTGSQLDEDSDPILSGDPFFQTGQKWKEGRARFSTLGTPARLRGVIPYIIQVCTPMNKYITNMRHQRGGDDGVEVKELAHKFVTDSLVSVLLGGNANSFSAEGSIFLEIGQAVFEDNIAQNLAMMAIIGAPHLAKLLKLRIVPKKTADILTKIIKDEILRRKQTGEERTDFFDHLLKRTENECEEQVCERMIKTIVTFYIEGFESSSLVSAFTLFNLAKNPDIQETLRQNIHEKALPGSQLTEEAVCEVKLLRNCILESMRLHSPVTMLQRKSNEDYTLRASTGEEVFLKKGCIVNIPICGNNDDDRIFPNPEVFDPERFEDAEQRRFFLSFGDGHRVCLGQQYSLQAISVLVASIVKDFHVEISPKMKLPMRFSSHPFFLYPADGVWLRFVPL